VGSNDRSLRLGFGSHHRMKAEKKGSDVKSGRRATFRHGSGWCRSRTRPATRNDWEASPRRATAICARCSWSGRSGEPSRWVDAPGLARRADGPPAGKGCRHRVGQQDRPHRLGADGPRYALQRACSASDLRYARPTRAHEVGKGNERIMHPAGRSGDRDTPLVPRQLLTACL